MSDPTNPGATPEPKADEPKPVTPEPKSDAKPDEPLGDNGKAALEAERKERKAAEKRAKEAEERLAAIEAERQQKADEDAAKAGEWEKLAGDRAAKLTEAQATLKATIEERDALAARVDAYETRDRQRITDGVKDLPEDLAAFDPGADAPLDQRLKWFETATEQNAKRQGAKPPLRFPATPRPNGDPKAGELKSLVTKQQAGYG